MTNNELLQIIEDLISALSHLKSAIQAIEKMRSRTKTP